MFACCFCASFRAIHHSHVSARYSVKHRHSLLTVSFARYLRRQAPHGFIRCLVAGVLRLSCVRSHFPDAATACGLLNALGHRIVRSLPCHRVVQRHCACYDSTFLHFISIDIELGRDRARVLGRLGLLPWAFHVCGRWASYKPFAWEMRHFAAHLGQAPSRPALNAGFDLYKQARVLRAQVHRLLYGLGAP